MSILLKLITFLMIFTYHVTGLRNSNVISKISFKTKTFVKKIQVDQNDPNFRSSRIFVSNIPLSGK